MEVRREKEHYWNLDVMRCRQRRQGVVHITESYRRTINMMMKVDWRKKNKSQSTGMEVRQEEEQYLNLDVMRCRRRHKGVVLITESYRRTIDMIKIDWRKKNKSPLTGMEVRRKEKYNLNSDVMRCRRRRQGVRSHTAGRLTRWWNSIEAPK